MAEPLFTRLIQICPDDHPPFPEICGAYRKAAEGLGLDGGDYYLAPAYPQAGVIKPKAMPGRGRLQGHQLHCRNLRSTRELARRLREALPDTSRSLVVCHRYRAHKAFLASSLKAAHMITVVHSPGFFARRRRRWAWRLSRRKAQLAGVGPGVVAELARTAGHAQLWRNALDIDAVRYLQRNEARRQLGLPVDEWICAVVGRLHYKKRPELALAGFRAFVEQGGKGRLAFVGAAIRDPQLEARLASASGDLAVSFLGFVPDAARIMPAFDLVLLTSLDESFGMVLLEAMAANVPVAAPRTPGPQWVLGSSLGHYFDGAHPQAVAAAMREAQLSPKRGGAERAQREFSVAAATRWLAALMRGRTPA